MDIEHIFVSLQNEDWRRRILAAPFAPKTTVCKDLSTREKWAQSNLKPVNCENGICGEMLIKETNGDVQVYRSCLKNENFELHSNCTKLLPSEDIVSAKMCLCATPLCNTKNGSPRYSLHY
uniref:Uncharacterized protein n=1 Tax=Plectus sambesii TaxID=2011161 RepID=A0A914WPV5_9BILA